MKREVDFWPHDVPPATPDSAIAVWWTAAIDKARQPWPPPLPEPQASAPAEVAP